MPSPKVATYDLQPEMSAPEVTDKLVEAIEQRDASTSSSSISPIPTWSAIPATSRPRSRRSRRSIAASAGSRQALTRAGGALLVTADHGNAEMMRDPATGQPHTAHTLNPVPLVLVNPPPGVTALGDGKLADIAPTLLALLGMSRRAAMTGQSLLRAAARAPA